MTSFYLLSSSPWPIGDEKFGAEARRNSETLPLKLITQMFIKKQSKVLWEIQRFGKLFGGICNVVKKTEKLRTKYNRN